MNKALLEQAQKRLRIRDVYQVEAHARLAEGYDPTQEAPEQPPTIQLKHLVRQSMVLEPVGSDAKDEPKLFRVYIELGVRWSADVQSKADVAEAASFSEIGSTYIAEYEIVEEIESAALTAFALTNASYHVWPYFREFVSTQTQRMNAPKLMIPMMRPASNQDVARTQQ